MKVGILSTQIYEDAKVVKNELIRQYNFIDIEKNKDISGIDCLVVLGGDGFMLRTIHNYYKYNIPFFGINYGNVGFLLNNKNCLQENLIDIIRNGQIININPLINHITNVENNHFIDISINELTIIRNVYKTCDIDITVNDIKRLNNYSGDGLVISTPIGSTAYNSSIGGSIISYKSNNIILSTISPFVPRTLKSVILQNNSCLKFDVNYSDVRSVSAFSDYIEYKNIKNIETYIDKNINIKLIFNKQETLDEKIINEQFRY